MRVDLSELTLLSATCTFLICDSYDLRKGFTELHPVNNIRALHWLIS